MKKYLFKKIFENTPASKAATALVLIRFNKPSGTLAYIEKVLIEEQIAKKAQAPDLIVKKKKF